MNGDGAEHLGRAGGGGFDVAGDFHALVEVRGRVGTGQRVSDMGELIGQLESAILGFDAAFELRGRNGAGGLGLELERGSGGHIGKENAVGCGDAGAAEQGGDLDAGGAVVGDNDARLGRIGGDAEAEGFDGVTGTGGDFGLSLIEHEAVGMDAGLGFRAKAQAGAIEERQIRRGGGGFDQTAVE